MGAWVRIRLLSGSPAGATAPMEIQANKNRPILNTRLQILLGLALTCKGCTG